MKTLLTFLSVMLALTAVAAQQSDWMPNVMCPDAPLSLLLRPTQASFANGTFTEFGADGARKFSARLRNGQYEKHYKPFGSVEVELSAFHRLNQAGTAFAIAEYHKTSIGGSSSNDCFVDVVAFKNGSQPVLRQQIQFGCDLSGSGSTVSADATAVTVRQGYKGDSRLEVVELRWNGSKFDVVGHNTEALSKSR